VRRQTGRIGTSTRVLGGLAAIALPVALGGVNACDLTVAFVVLPLVAIVAAAATRREGPWVRGVSTLALVVAVEVGLTFLTALDGGTALWLFVGGSLLVAAVRGDAGCEMVAIPNALAGRRDPSGCIVYAPIDAAERAMNKRHRKG
jgi:hypothetical protein